MLRDILQWPDREIETGSAAPREHLNYGSLFGLRDTGMTDVQPDGTVRLAFGKTRFDDEERAMLLEMLMLDPTVPFDPVIADPHLPSLHYKSNEDHQLMNINSCGDPHCKTCGSGAIL